MVISEGHDFVEGNSYDDVKFKCELLKDHIILYIHELDYSRYDQEMSAIGSIIKRGYKTILIIDNYDVGIIDDALAIGVHDIVEMSVDQKILSKKIKNIIKPEEVKSLVEVETNYDESHKIHDKNIIDNEIARALRGGYELSMILIKGLRYNPEVMRKVMESLKVQLRDTDRVLHYDAEQILLICPFTRKSYIVDVENKVRAIYDKVDDENHLFTLYGLTYPSDVSAEEDILSKLEKGIRNSLLIGNLKGTLTDIGFEQFEAYKKMLQ